MRCTWLVLALAACDGTGSTGDTDTDTDAISGDDDDGVDLVDCEDAFVACGGDASGTWNVAAVCRVPFDDMGCDALTYEVTADRSSGTITLAPSGTYDRDYHVDVDFTVEVPSACLLGLGCAQLAAMSGGVLASCDDSAGGCTCAGAAAYDDAATGTWAVDGTDLVFDGDDRNAYCVQGDQGVSVGEDETRIQWIR